VKKKKTKRKKGKHHTLSSHTDMHHSISTKLGMMIEVCAIIAPSFYHKQFSRAIENLAEIAPNEVKCLQLCYLSS